MNIIISLMYAPLIFFSLKYFDIQSLSIGVGILSTLWYFFTIKQRSSDKYYPLVYIFVALCGFFLEKVWVLQLVPLFISLIITSLFFISYLNKKSIILYFIKKFSQKEIDENEKNYIQKSTFFWVILSSLNTIFHLYFYVQTNLEFWVYYSSFGWCLIFLIGGSLQYIHRKFVFQNGTPCV